jgi:hypothetical protein
MGRGFPVPVSNPNPRVVYDSTGAGVQSTGLSGSSFSFTHTISGNAVILGLSVFWLDASTNAPSLVKVGTTTMSLLGTQQITSGGFWQNGYIYGLLNPPTGSQTVSFSLPTRNAVSANSVSYAGVAKFGTFVAATGTGTAISQTVNGLSGRNRVVNVLAPYTTAGVTGYSQTTRYNPTATAGQNTQLVIGDAVGASSTAFSATVGSTVWASIAVPLISC